MGVMRKVNNTFLISMHTCVNLPSHLLITHPCQYGFREKNSTTHALVKVVSETTNSLNKRKHSIGVFIDLQKAFDTVDHQLLCTKLDFYGIRGVAYQ